MITVALARSDLLAWTGGHALGPWPDRLAGVATDSRERCPGALFVALRGERFDGHAFLGDALAGGAAAALVERGTQAPAASEGLPRLEVDDTLRAFGALARGHRRRFAPLVVAVTGSVGKTTTKELVAAALSPMGPVLKTLGNQNNEIGVPLTLLRLEASHGVAVVELGMNHEGEIARLGALAEPAVGLVTNVRGVHLETLGTLERVAYAKGELFQALPPDGTAVVGSEEPLALARARASGRRIVTFGRGRADVRLLEILASDLTGTAFRAEVAGREVRARVAFLGEHNALNGCAALACALVAGVDPEAAAAALSEARPAPHRLAVVALPGEIVLLDDCYNANPHSVAAALDTLRSIASGRRLGAVLGDMLELGPEEYELHRRTGEKTSGLAFLLAFGPRSAALAEGARAAGVPMVAHTTKLDEGVEWLRGQLRPGDLLLLKASHGMHLERFAHALGAPNAGGL